MVGLDALQFQRLHGGGLALNFLLQAFQQFALLNDDAVHHFNLMFKMREVRLEPLHAPVIFVCHESSLPARHREVEVGENPSAKLKRSARWYAPFR